jgi:cytochrome c2
VLERPAVRLRRPLLALGAPVAVLLGCAQPPEAPAGPGVGDPERGAVLMVREACGACHEIPGIQEAEGQVGPPLHGVARRTIIAGVLPNTPDNMTHWLRDPQAVVPGNAMPDAGLSEQQARDMAAYLATLR